MKRMKHILDRIYRLLMPPVYYWRKRGAVIGDDCEIYKTASLGSEPYLIKIGNHVRINPGVVFVNHDGAVWVLRHLQGLDAYRNIDSFGIIRIGENVHIGTNAIIMPGVKIGNNCIIGCGAIVTKDVPDNSVAAGVPARIIESVDEYFRKNESKFVHTKGMSEENKRKHLEKKYNNESINS